MPVPDSTNDAAVPGPSEVPTPAPSEPRDYQLLPWYRKSGVCSGIIVAHLVVSFLGRCVPLLGAFGVLTTLGVIAVCISVLTGPIYYDKQRKDGTLKSWGWANKIAAVFLLLFFVAVYVALMWFLVAGGQFGGGTPAKK